MPNNGRRKWQQKTKTVLRTQIQVWYMDNRSEVKSKISHLNVSQPLLLAKLLLTHPLIIRFQAPQPLLQLLTQRQLIERCIRLYDSQPLLLCVVVEGHDPDRTNVGTSTLSSIQLCTRTKPHTPSNLCPLIANTKACLLINNGRLRVKEEQRGNHNVTMSRQKVSTKEALLLSCYFHWIDMLHGRCCCCCVRSGNKHFSCSLRIGLRPRGS